MRFAESWVLCALWSLLLIALIYLRDEAKRKKLLALWGGEVTLARLAQSVSWKKRWFQKGLDLLSFLLILMALAHPLIGKSQEEVKRRGLDIVIAVDTSSSMLAEDFAPNRLKKAKRELAGFLNQLHGNRLGLLAFSGAALVLSPLTLDVSALKIYLDVLDTQLIGVQGTALGEAIRQSLSLFEKGKTHGKLIILLTDGEDQGTKPLEAAQEAQALGIRIYTIGIGRGEGEPIPLLDESGQRVGHKRDVKGEVVLTRLDEETLKEISARTGGAYYRATPGEGEIEKIFRVIKKLEKGELGKKVLIHYDEKFQAPLILALFCLVMGDLMGERKGFFKRIKSVFLKVKPG